MIRLIIWSNADAVSKKLDTIYKEIADLGDPKVLGTYFLLEKLEAAREEAQWVANNSQDDYEGHI